MTRRLKLLLALTSVTAVTFMTKATGRWRRPAPVAGPHIDEFADLYAPVDDGLTIDDDAAAEIIRRARPALERARDVQL